MGSLVALLLVGYVMLGKQIQKERKEERFRSYQLRNDYYSASKRKKESKKMMKKIVVHLTSHPSNYSSQLSVNTADTHIPVLTVDQQSKVDDINTLTRTSLYRYKYSPFSLFVS